MTGTMRTPSGGRIDRARPVTFSFDGRRLTGLAGDTLASALIANGIHLAGRSFKYHRPRGILAAGSEEPSALVTVDRGQGRRTPNLRATQVEIHDGLVAETQNRWPGVGFDVGAVNDRLGPLIPAGFYYKTFMGPSFARGAKLWRRLYEPLIRRAAGLGRAPVAPDPDRYLHRYAHCDVLVVGAGPAGVAAALAAAETGARVILADEQAEPGGALLAETDAQIDGRPAQAWLAGALAELGGRANVRLLTRTTVFGAFIDNMIGLAERVTDHLATPDPRLPRERMWMVRAKEVVLATGAIERPLVFPDNDRPGVMLADAGRVYLERYGALAGKRVVVATAADSAYAAALAFKKAGAEIVAIADLRNEPGPAAMTAQAAGIAVHAGYGVHGTHGRLRVEGVELGPPGRIKPSRSERTACDLVLMCGGWTPSVHLFSQVRGKLVWSEALGAYVPGVPAERMRCAGAVTGELSLVGSLAQGLEAGLGAARAAGVEPKGASRGLAVTGERDATATAGLAPVVKGGRLSKAFVDYQNDVTAKDIELATREGFRSIEHVKRYTTTGMATDQGKTSNINALAVAAKALGTEVPAIGLTSYRMPFTPVTFGAFAGTARNDLFDPVRRTPMHAWARANGAVFEDVGTWKRARYFTRTAEDMDRAVTRECIAVRAAAGIFDASTLGKIEVTGRDAAEFLDRIYTGRMSTLGVGRCRYGLMLTEAGFIMDDGIVGRLAPDRFHVTTTTGGAARVLNHMEDYAQTEWPGLDVWLTSVTEQWAVIAVQGPKARDVIAPLVSGIDLATAAMPHMSVREGKVAGISARLFRVSFTGEMGYEINVPADYGAPVWEAVIEAGRPHGLTAYGTEAMHVLRAEKGYVIVGQDTDGTQVPADVGLGWMIAKSKPDFVGKRSLVRPDMLKADRPALVGLLPEDPSALPEEGAQIVADPRQPKPMSTLGHVTSAYYSAALGRTFCLALLKGGARRVGDTLYVPLVDRTIPVRVVAPVFVDQEGGRLDA